MITKFHDIGRDSDHDKFQVWRSRHQDGILLTLETRSRAKLHGTRCRHLGSGPPYYSLKDGHGSLTSEQKICGSERELLAWATENGISVTRCLHCLGDNLIGNEQTVTADVMRINRFFTEILGASLRNSRWSWGAVDPRDNRVFLRVWKDQIETVKDGQRVEVALDQPRIKSPGLPERHAHLRLIRDGAEGFGIVCTAVDSDTSDARTIADFDRTMLLRLGVISQENGHTYAFVNGHVPVGEVTRRRTAQSTIAEDILEIQEQKIPETTKVSLINARIGQGNFRTLVLSHWQNCCSVTKSCTECAIRASHIKPWRSSNNDERLDPQNGLPLVASLDALFDAGLISFESTGRLIVSSKLSVMERQIHGVNEKTLRKKPSAKMAEYLAYHREHILLP